MDLQEFNSPPPKPWLIINGASFLASATNGTNATTQAPFSGLVPTNLTPANLATAPCFNIPVYECIVGMSINVRVYCTLQAAVSTNFRLWLAQDALATPITPYTDLSSGVLASATPVFIDLNFIVSALGVAGTASCLGSVKVNGGGSTGALTVNNTTFHTDAGLNIALAGQWAAAGANMVIYGMTVERVY